MNNNDPLINLVAYYNTFAEEQVDINNVRNNPELIVQIATEALRHARSHNSSVNGRTGMDSIADIVLNDKRDIKRVRKAATYQGAQDIVNKRNRRYPNSKPWTAHNADVNNDGIPDIIIRNGDNHPLTVNGYTTTRSNWPAYHLYYTDRYGMNKQQRNDLKEELENTYGAANPRTYMKRQTHLTYNIDQNGDLHNIGNVTRYQLPNGWDLSRLTEYTIPTNKRKSAYDRFNTYIIKPVRNRVISYLEEQHAFFIPGTLKGQMYAKVLALMWKHFIINHVANYKHMNVDNEEFQKWLKKKDGKTAVDHTVTRLLYDVVHTRENWSEEQRTQLANHLHDKYAQFLNQVCMQMQNAQATFHPEHYQQPMPEHIQHDPYIPGLQSNHDVYNAQTDGILDNDVDADEAFLE